MRKMIKLFILALCCQVLAAEELTLEQKVGQLLIAHFRGEEANEEARILIQEAHVGGIIYYNWANGLYSKVQVQELSTGLQKMAEIPLLIAVDQEGGRVTRLREGFTQSPGNQVLGGWGDPETIELVAYVMGKELADVGVIMNLAPVVDVNVNPENPVIGDRSFGSDPMLVAQCGAAALRGYQNGGVMTCLKHFPGHGDVEVDSHLDLPVVSKALTELEEVELFPFAELARHTDAIMTGHIVVPAIDPEMPATLSEPVLSYLRDTLEFSGVIIADSLVMEGVLKSCEGNVDEAALRAVQAGCDMVILGGRLLTGTSEGRELTVSDVQRVHRSLVEAVRCGRVDEERVNQAVSRVLKLKDRSRRGEARP